MRLIDADALKCEMQSLTSNLENMAESMGGQGLLCKRLNTLAEGVQRGIDMLNEQPTINKSTIIDGSTTTAYGYNLDEICKFAMVCRKEGITENQLHDFVMNMENAVQVVLKEQQEIIERTFLEITKRTGEPET